MMKKKQRHPWIAPVIAANILLTLAACHQVKSSEKVPRSPTVGGTVPAQTSRKGGGLPQCPPGKPVSSPPRAAAMHHKVVLSWNASTSAGQPGNNAVGYCIYRSEQQISVKNLKDCNSCEQVSPAPILDTGCVDDGVRDGKAYFYVAITIDTGKQVSDFSNQVMAVIPPDKASVGSPTSLPSCREAAGTRPPSAEVPR